jgi:dUTP pyrophosphatase
MREKVTINCKFEGDTLPKYTKQGDSAMDLHAWKFREVSKGELLPEQDFTEEGYALQPFDRILIPTGLKLELPKDIDADVRPRSGLTLKNGIMVALGTIDSNYTGDVGMIVMNLSKEEFVIKRGDRIGQLKFAVPVEAELNVVNEIHTTDRGEAGFGSSGK